MKNSRPQWDSNQEPSAYDNNTLSVELLELIDINHLEVTPFYLIVLLKVTLPLGR